LYRLCDSREAHVAGRCARDHELANNEMVQDARRRKAPR
jgi:hypothetical protein